MMGRSSCLLVTGVVLSAWSGALGQAGGVHSGSHLRVGSASTDIPGADFVGRGALPRPPVVTSHIVLSWPRFVRAAGTIFSGTVIRIERREARLGQAVETVAVTFRVENAIRGAVPGEELTITQWMGLWSSGQRYRVGERVMLFLYPKSKLGLTSCVGGPLGRFTVDAREQVLLRAEHVDALRGDPVVGGKSRVRFSDFALAVRQAREEK